VREKKKERWTHKRYIDAIRSNREGHRGGEEKEANRAKKGDGRSGDRVGEIVGLQSRQTEREKELWYVEQSERDV